MSEREVVVERVRAIVARQREAMAPLLPEIERWRDAGLDGPTAACLAFGGDGLDVYATVRAIGAELAAALRELEAIDPTGQPMRERLRQVVCG